MVRYRSVLIVVVVVCAALSGYVSAAPERRAEADRLESDLAAMPGVEELSVLYSNDFTQGVSLDVDVTMTQASESRIADVANRISESHRTEFREYDRTTDFTVGDRLEVRSGDDLDPEHITGVAEQLRRMGAGLAGAGISWHISRPLPRIEIEGGPAAAEALQVVREVLGSRKASLEIRPEEPEPVWSVELPLDAEQERAVRRQLAELPVADTHSVGVLGSRITALAVTIRDPRTAYRDLVATIGVIEPTRDHPLNLSWGFPPADEGDLRFSGRAVIHGCPQNRTAGDEEPQRYYVPAAVDLQQRMQNEYETCPG